MPEVWGGPVIRWGGAHEECLPGGISMMVFSRHEGHEGERSRNRQRGGSHGDGAGYT